VKLVYTAAPGTSLVNVFPSLAIDRAGNLYIAFSDSHSVLLTVSGDQAATWTIPVRVSNGSGTKSALGPWITAGDPGKVNITWWGTSSANNNDATAQWRIFFAQSQNALAGIPIFRPDHGDGSDAPRSYLYQRHWLRQRHPQPCRILRSRPVSGRLGND